MIEGEVPDSIVLIASRRTKHLANRGWLMSPSEIAIDAYLQGLKDGSDVSAKTPLSGDELRP